MKTRMFVRLSVTFALAVMLSVVACRERDQTPPPSPAPTQPPPLAPTQPPPPAPTQSPPSGFAVTSVTASATPTNFTGACPKTVDFSGAITANGPGTVSYMFEYSTGGTGPTLSINFTAAGSKTVAGGNANVNTTGVYWVRLRVLSPAPLTSNQATYTITCTGGQAPSANKPDLVWTEFKTPDKKNVGDNISVNVTMKNVGTKETGPFAVCYEIAGPNGSVVHQETKTYSSLDPDHYNTGSWPFGDKYVAQTAGTYTFRGTLDCQAQVDESNESNNKETAQLVVVAGAAVPAAPTGLILGTQTFDLTGFTLGVYDNADNEQGFYLYVNGTRRATIPANPNKGQMTIFLHQLLPGAFSCNQNYKFQVTAFNATGESARSNEFAWTVKCQP